MDHPKAPLKRPDRGSLVSILLRLACSLTCLGYTWRFHHFSNKTFSFLWGESGWSEPLAGRVVFIMTVLLVLSSFCIWIRNLRWLALTASVVMLVEMVLETALPSAKYPGLYWAEWAMRYTIPVIALFLIQPTKKSKVWSGGIMRVAIALTFAVHGLKALLGDPHFVDFILVLCRKMNLGGVTEAHALTGLHVIGTIDLLLAAHLIGFRVARNRMVLIWMAVWGAITAFSRITYGGWGNWHEVLIRSTHFMMPVALLLMYREKCELNTSEKRLPEDRN
jgi:hypothetical protein